MKILHCMLAIYYADNFNYQENILPRIHKQNGNEVMILASCETLSTEGRMMITTPRDYINEDSIPVTRLPYCKLFSKGLFQKFRSYPGVYERIETFAPDVIFFHNIQSWELITVAKYKKKHPNIRLYCDNHAFSRNSATNRLSYHVLHRLYYRLIIQFALPQISKILCVSIEAMDFCRDLYSIPDNMLEFYPLGGIIVPEDERKKQSQEIRANLNVADSTTVFTHSGKMDALKRTPEIIRAFSAVEGENLRLWIAGVFMDDIKKESLRLIDEDSRISYLGWKSGDELLKILCATDVYVQPGGQSVTMQNAICSGCAMLLYPCKSHEPFLQGNGFYVVTEDDIKARFIQIQDDPELIHEMRKNSYKIAEELLDYRKLAARVY